jgi:hypothetical protein
MKGEDLLRVLLENPAVTQTFKKFAEYVSIFMI